MRKISLIFCTVTLFSGCVSNNIADYEPIVDPSNTDMTKFSKDLVQCRSIGADAKIKYEKKASKQAMDNMLTGLVVGAITGAVVGAGSDYQSELTTYGAASGMAAGAAASSDAAIIARYGPNRIVDRCMINRGYKILNDLGTGITE